MDFTAYISNLSADKRTLLYRSPWTSLAVFRNLPPLAQVYVMRLLFVPAPFPADYLDSWMSRSSSASSAHRAALAALRDLDVLLLVGSGQRPQGAGPGAGQWQQVQAGFGTAGAAAAAGGGDGGLAKLQQQLQQQLQASKAAKWALHPDFRAQLQRVVCCGSQLMSGDVPLAAAATAPSLEQLGEWGNGQWEVLQLYLLGSAKAPPGLPPLLRNRNLPELDLRALLVEAGLLAHPARIVGGGHRGSTPHSSLAVTQRGFHFLLQPPDRQLWGVLQEYISGAEAASGEELASTLSFLLQLGFRRVGQPCGWGELRPPEQRMAAHLVQLGLLAVFQAADGSLYYTPTRLASSLCGGGASGVAAAGVISGAGAEAGGDRTAAAGTSASAAAGGAAAGASGADFGINDAYIIVESNYRVYAYTRSPVTIAVLELFVRREALLPNLFVGAIRRDSILSALSRGIKADELVSYLAARPHPSIASRSPVVPEVVSDQIRLWEASMNRLRADTAILYEKMENRELYDRAVAFARTSGSLLWEDNAKMRFVALDSGHEAMKGFIVRAKQELRL